MELVEPGDARRQRYEGLKEVLARTLLKAVKSNELKEEHAYLLMRVTGKLDEMMAPGKREVRFVCRAHLPVEKDDTEGVTMIGGGKTVSFRWHELAMMRTHEFDRNQHVGVLAACDDGMTTVVFDRAGLAETALED